MNLHSYFLRCNRKGIPLNLLRFITLILAISRQFSISLICIAFIASYLLLISTVSWLRYPKQKVQRVIVVFSNKLHDLQIVYLEYVSRQARENGIWIVNHVRDCLRNAQRPLRQ